jgi:hypothetical protein
MEDRVLGVRRREAEPGQGVADLRGRLIGTVAVADPAVGPDDVPDRYPRDGRSVGEAAPLQDGRPVLDDLALELRHEAGLAHPRLAHDGK